MAVQGLGGELRAFRLKLGEGGGLARGARACRCRERQLGDDRLDGYIACSIPTRSVHARVGEGVQKHVVQHDVQVCARKLFEGARHVGRAVAQVRAIGGDGLPGLRQQLEMGERGVHEAQADQQLVAGQLKGLLGKPT